jgi:hypothetical protein
LLDSRTAASSAGVNQPGGIRAPGMSAHRKRGAVG